MRPNILIGFAATIALAFSTPAQEFKRLGILLDTSGEMGHLVPQARKEVRLLNAELEKAGREPVVLRELEGASVDQPGALGLPARKNAIVVVQQMFAIDKVNRVFWITHLKGKQTGSGPGFWPVPFPYALPDSRYLSRRNPRDMP